MKIYWYDIIAACPFFLWFIIQTLVSAVCYYKAGKPMIDPIEDFIVFNLFSEILKSKKDDRHRTVVYLRQEKVLLQGDTLNYVKKALGNIYYFFIADVLFLFGQFAFVEITYDCEDGKDCFVWPMKTAFDAAVHANCSDPAIEQGKTLVICYRLVLQLELAFGVTFGLYKIGKALLSVGVTLIIKLNKNHIKRFKIVVGIISAIGLVTTVVLVLVYQSHPFMRSSSGNVKIFITIFLGYIITMLLIYDMPWKQIIRGKENANNVVREVGLDSPVNERQDIDSIRL